MPWRVLRQRFGPCVPSSSFSESSNGEIQQNDAYEIGRARGTHRIAFFTECSHKVIRSHYSAAQRLPVGPARASLGETGPLRPARCNRRRGPRLRSLQAHRRGDRYSGGRDVARDEKEEITLLGKAVEEEKNAGDVVETLKMVGDKSEALFLLNRELGQRRVEEQPAG